MPRLVPTPVVVIVILTLLAQHAALAYPATPAPAAQLPTIKAQVVLYKDGELVYTGPDVVTRHWLAALLATFFREDTAYSIVTESGASIQMICTGTYDSISMEPAPFIEAGVSTQIETPGVSRLAQLWRRSMASAYTVVYDSNTNSYTVNITGYVFNNETVNVTVTEVGLSLGVYDNSGAREEPLDYILVSYNVVSPGVVLEPNSTLTITYVFTIKLDPPFTVNFYNLVVLYGLGVKRLADNAGAEPPAMLTVKDSNGNAVYIDTCIDWGTQDSIVERLGYQLTSVSVTSPITLYNTSGSPLVSSYSAGTAYDEATNTIYQHGRVAWFLENGGTYNAVAAYLATDTDQRQGYVRAGTILIAVMPLGQDYRVPVMSALGVGYTVKIYSPP